MNHLELCHELRKNFESASEQKRIATDLASQIIHSFKVKLNIRDGFVTLANGQGTNRKEGTRLHDVLMSNNGRWSFSILLLITPSGEIDTYPRAKFETAFEFTVLDSSVSYSYSPIKKDYLVNLDQLKKHFEEICLPKIYQEMLMVLKGENVFKENSTFKLYEH